MPVNDFQGTLANGKLTLESAAGKQVRAANDGDKTNPLASITPAQILTAIDGMAIPPAARQLLKLLVRQQADLQRQINQLKK